MDRYLKWTTVSNWTEFYKALPVWIDKEIVSVKYLPGGQIGLGTVETAEKRLCLPPTFNRYALARAPFTLTTVREVISKYGGSKRNYVVQIGETWYEMVKPFVTYQRIRIYVDPDELELANILEMNGSYDAGEYIRFIADMQAQQRRAQTQENTTGTTPRNYGL